MRVALLFVTAAALAAAAVTVQADFAGVDGFSGRVADCTSCHVPPPAATFADGPATVTLDGLPDAWTPGTDYLLTVTVAGGPPALPAPQPQGGFELEVGAGRLGVPDSMDGLLRQPTPTGMTYTPAGTLVRTWNVTWTAPTLEARPADVPVWLAAVSANGNHVIATNRSDQGELGDSVATLTATVPAAPEADAAWRALPLLPPTVTADGALDLSGRHADANATHLATRVDGGDWQTRPTGTDWRIHLPARPDTLEVRSEGADRVSPTVLVTFDSGVVVHEPGAPAPDQDVPAPTPVLSLLALAAVLILRNRP